MVIQVRVTIIQLILHRRIALLLAFVCWLNASFRQDGTVSPAAAVRCNLNQAWVFIPSSLGDIFSLPAAALRPFPIAHRRSQYNFQLQTSGDPQTLLQGNLLSGCHQTLLVVTILSQLSIDFPRCYWSVPVVYKVDTYSMLQQLPRHHPQQPLTIVCLNGFGGYRRYPTLWCHHQQIHWVMSLGRSKCCRVLCVHSRG